MSKQANLTENAITYLSFIIKFYYIFEISAFLLCKLCFMFYCRMYVCQELYNAQMETPVVSAVPRHDLSLFPTVTDLKNHIHQAVKDIENGTLALTAPTVCIVLLLFNCWLHGYQQDLKKLI